MCPHELFLKMVKTIQNPLWLHKSAFYFLQRQYYHSVRMPKFQLDANSIVIKTLTNIPISVMREWICQRSTQSYAVWFSPLCIALTLRVKNCFLSVILSSAFISVKHKHRQRRDICLFFWKTSNLITVWSYFVSSNTRTV